MSKHGPEATALETGLRWAAVPRGTGTPFNRSRDRGGFRPKCFMCVCVFLITAVNSTVFFSF